MEPSLTNAEDVLWLRFRNNDPQAKIDLLHMYMDLVDSIAHKLKLRLPSHVSIDDLRSAGQEGLWKALHSFAPEKGIPFRAYATTRIRGAMLDELRKMDELSRNQRAQWKQAQAAYGLQASYQQTSVSLDDLDRYEWIVDDDSMSPEERAIRSAQVAELNRAIMKLSQQEQLVLSLVFVEGLSLAETAEVLSLSRSRVSTIYNTALKRLKGSVMRGNRKGV
jgi:RNA polymerase sigma factor for flagellar operon FliA